MLLGVLPGPLAFASILTPQPNVQRHLAIARRVRDPNVVSSVSKCHPFFALARRYPLCHGTAVVQGALG